MRRIILALGLVLSGHGGAWANCPAVLTDCPAPIFNGLTSGGDIKVPDGVALVMSSDAIKKLSFQSSPNAFVFDNAILQPNLGIQLPDGQPLVLNATEGTASLKYDTTLGAVRLQNVPLQVDAGIAVIGGNVAVSGSVTTGSGLDVVGNYPQATNPGLDFRQAVFATGVPAINLGDNNAIAFSSANNGFAIAPNATTNQLSVLFNGAPVWSVDNTGVMSCGGVVGCSIGGGGGGGGAGNFSSLAVTGPATVATTLTVSGSTTAGNPLLVGPGGTGNANITQNGTGAFFITTGSAASLLRIGMPGGVGFVDFEGATKDVKITQPLWLTGGAQTLTSTSLIPGFNMTGTFSGTSTAVNATNLNQISVTDTVVHNPQGLNTLAVTSLLGAGLTGPRNGIITLMNQTATSGNTGTGGLPKGTAFGPLTAYALSSVNDNGTDLLNNAGGALWGFNSVAGLNTGATFYGGAISYEADVFAATGTSVRDKIGIAVVLTSQDQVHGARSDVGLTFNDQTTQSGTGIGWNTLIAVGSPQGYWPVNIANGSIMAAFANQTGDVVPLGAKNGIDLHNVVFSGNSWDDGHVAFGGNGDMRMNSVTTLATGATVGFLHLPHTLAPPTGTPTDTTPGCAWNTATHALNCYDGTAWYHFTGLAGAG